jgi:hypothetical protein
MKVPTDATTVFYPSVQTGVNNISGQFITTGFPPDLSIEATANTSTGNKWTLDRLRGNNQFISTDQTVAESNLSPYGINFTTSNVGVQNIDYGTSSSTYVNWLFGRAPSFMDVVCYTGTGSNAQLVNHNLTVPPELVIIKNRTSTYDWIASNTQGYGSPSARFGVSTTNPYGTNADLSSGFTSTTFLPYYVAGYSNVVTASGENYVAYLFATCPGVSKVGTYTGNGTTQTINCGFTGGARFVLIKRKDSTGDWYTYDTARGMTVLTDPYSSLNNGAGSTATLGSVTTVSTGFAVNASVLAAINTNGASYIFLAIA